MAKESSAEETKQFMLDLENLTKRVESLDTATACMLHLVCAAIYADKIKELTGLCMAFAIEVLDIEPFAPLDTTTTH